MSAPIHIPYVKWAAVQAMVGNDIPYSELPTDHMYYFRETGAHLVTTGMPPFSIVTAGVIAVIKQRRAMKKEAEFKVAIEKIASQQQESNARYDQLAVQYE